MSTEPQPNIDGNSGSQSSAGNSDNQDSHPGVPAAAVSEAAGKQDNGTNADNGTEQAKPIENYAEMASGLLRHLRRLEVWDTVIAGILAIIAVLQLYAMSTANTAAVNAANSARDSVDLARTTAERQLRAYVHITAAQLRPVEGTKSVDGGIVIENVGQTPAYDVAGRIFHRVTDAPFPAENIAWSLEAAAQQLGGPLGAGKSLTRRHDFDIEDWATLQKELAAGRKILWVFGYFTYKDIFGEPHRIKFRRFIGGDAGIPDGLAMAVAAIGNEEDSPPTD